MSCVCPRFHQTSHLLYGLEVVNGKGEVLRLPELVHHAAVVKVGGEHVQEPHELERVLLEVESDRLVIDLLVSDLLQKRRFSTGHREGGGGIKSRSEQTNYQQTQHDVQFPVLSLWVNRKGGSSGEGRGGRDRERIPNPSRIGDACRKFGVFLCYELRGK